MTATISLAVAIATSFVSYGQTSQTQTSTTTYPAGQQTTTVTTTTTAPYDFTNMNDKDRAMWLMRDMRASDKWAFQELMDWAPSHINILVFRSLSNVQQMGLQQMMIGAESAMSQTTTTTVTQPSVPAPTDQSSTTTVTPTQTTTTTTQTTNTPSQTTTVRTTTVNPNWTSTINYSGGRMSDLQAQETLLMGLSENERSAMRHWLDSLTDADIEVLLTVVKDTFDSNATMYPFYNSYFRSMSITRTP